MNTTIQQEEKKPLPPLLKGSSTYKLIVPAKVEEKIRYLIRKFPHTEWSGVLFYTHQGSFEGNNLVITCQDIYPMDLGTSGWTEFKMSEDVAAYITDNMELFDCESGLVHSHHTLGAFFSGQDMKMIQQEGEDTNCFVSLVVDTKGTYVAMVTRKVQTKSEVTIKKLGTSYEFFGEGTKTLTNDNTETTKTIDKEVIEYFDLKVERQEVPNTLDYLDARFEEIEKKKKQSTKSNPIPWKSQADEDKGFFDYLHQDNKQKHLSQELPLFDKSKDIQGIKWQPDPAEIHAAAVHIITLNLILNPEKLDLKQWIMKHMTNMYKKVFGDNSLIECKQELCGAFTEYRDFIIQFTIDYFNYDTVPPNLADNDFDYIQGMVAQAIIDEIFEYVEVNPYIKSYYNALSQYIV